MERKKEERRKKGNEKQERSNQRIGPFASELYDGLANGP